MNVRAVADTLKRYSGVANFLIAFSAMAATVYQGWLTREHNRLSVKPHIRFAPELEGKGKRNGLYIANVGLGPATLTALEIGVKGQRYNLLVPGGLRAAIKAMNVDLKCFSDIQPEVGTVLKAGDFEPIIIPSGPVLEPDPCPAIVALTLMNQSIEVYAAYESFYEQKFETRQVIAVDKGALLERLH